jgi:hypothetical protein
MVTNLLDNTTAYYRVASFYREDKWNKKPLLLTIKKETN